MKNNIKQIQVISILFLSMFVTLNASGQEKPLRSDGPYIIYNENSTVRFMQVEADGKIVDTILNKVPRSFIVTSDDGKHSFEVELGEFKKKKAIIKTNKKIFSLADPHADFDSFISVLMANKVIDNKFNWSFGKNNLVINGDILDRGDDATTILWLVYKLQMEAEKAGGDVYCTIGNHEDMVLKGDDRYINKKYSTLADTLKIEHKEFYSKNSELGRWIRSYNIIQVLNNNMFVHAGLGDEFIERGLDVEFVNSSTEQYLGMSKVELKEVGGDIEFIYRTFGPLWYRGMVSDDEKYRPILTENVKKILEIYDVDRIILGHTKFDDITVIHDGMVITTNVRNRENMESGRGRGILIDKNKIFVVYDAQKPQRLRND